MHKLKILKQQMSFPEAIERAVDFRAPAVDNDERLFDNYAQSTDRFAIIGSALQRISREVADHDFLVPEVPPLSAAAAALPRNETRELMVYNLQHAIAALAEALDTPKFGRVTWSDGESCRFTYRDAVRNCGIFRNTIRRVVHQHDVVKARQHKLPASGIAIPKRGQQILRAMPDPLRPHVRVITGLLVQKQEHEDPSREELTWLGQAFEDGKRQARRAANAAVAAISVAGKAVATATSDALSSVNRALAVADPAIVIGDVCLYGWES